MPLCSWNLGSEVAHTLHLCQVKAECQALLASFYQENKDVKMLNREMFQGKVKGEVRLCIYEEEESVEIHQ